jgi:hypothetical protein
MRKRNWKEYNKELVQRGSLTFLIDENILNSKPKNCHKNGRPQEFSDPLITMLMMVKINFRLTYRALEGFMKYLSPLNNWECSIPSYSLICKRAAFIKGALPKLSKCSSATILIDASGAKVLGEGEWKVKIHGKQKRRKWVKIHIAIDSKTQEIVAEATTESNVADSTMIETLLDQVQGSIKITMADGAYDHASARSAIRRRGSKALIPPPKNARYKQTNDDRDEALCIIEALGGGKEGRSLWGKLTGYSMRALVESTFSRMKRIFGDRLFSKIPVKQALENRLRCLILNKMRRKEHLPDASALGYRLG